MSLKCPECGGYTKLLETRTRPDGSVRRRHECGKYHRITTVAPDAASEQRLVIAMDLTPQKRGRPARATA